MKTFEARQTNLTDGKDKLSYASLALLSLNTVPAKGVTYVEMGQRLDLIKKLKAAKPGDKIKLDDKEIIDLATSVQEMRWNTIKEEIRDFGAYVASLIA